MSRRQEEFSPKVQRSGEGEVRMCPKWRQEGRVVGLRVVEYLR